VEDQRVAAPAAARIAIMGELGLALPWLRAYSRRLVGR
jgi:hypothetical protein